MQDPVAKKCEPLLNCLRDYSGSSPSDRCTSGSNRAIFGPQTFRQCLDDNRLILIVGLVLSHIS